MRKATAKTYRDRTKCPKDHSFVVWRRFATAGRKVRTYCQRCGCAYQIKAGAVPSTSQTSEGAGDAAN